MGTFGKAIASLLAATAPFLAVCEEKGPASAGSLAPRSSKDLKDTAFGLCVYSAQDLKIAGEAGFHFVRRDLSWGSVERQKGVYDFKDYDKFMEELDAWGLKALFILGGANKAYGGIAFVDSQEGLDAWAAFVEKAVERYKGKALGWEVWNEANIDVFFPRPSSDYMKALKAASKAIRKADPSATITMTGMSETDFRFLGECLDAGAAELVDVIAYHPYRPLPELAEPNQEHGRTYEETLGALRSVVAGASPRLKVWNTEHGIQSALPTTGVSYAMGTSELMQAKYQLRRMILESSLDLERSVLFYAKQRHLDGSTTTYNTKALCDLDGSPKRAYFAVRNALALFDKSVKTAKTPFELGPLSYEGDAAAPDPLLIEAESGALKKEGGGLFVKADPTASGGACLSTPDSDAPYEARRKAGGYKPDEPAGAYDNKDSASFKFSVAGEGRYYIFGHVKAPCRMGTSNSFFVKLDGAPEFLWDTPETGEEWRWSYIGPRNAKDDGTFKLEPGERSISFRVREDGTELDALMIATGAPKSVFREAPLKSACFADAEGKPLLAFWKASVVIDWLGLPEGKAELFIKSDKIKEPVLVDLLDPEGRVLKLESFERKDGGLLIHGLPVRDYPMIVADKSSVKLR